MESLKRRHYPAVKPRRGKTTLDTPPSVTAGPVMDVRRYVKSDGWVTRYWAIYIGDDLLAVCVYKKGAVAVAGAFHKLRETMEEAGAKN